MTKAMAALFLASAEPSFIPGAVLPVDSGGVHGWQLRCHGRSAHPVWLERVSG